MIVSDTMGIDLDTAGCIPEETGIFVTVFPKLAAVSSVETRYYTTISSRVTHVLRVETVLRFTCGCENQTLDTQPKK